MFAIFMVVIVGTVVGVLFRVMVAVAAARTIGNAASSNGSLAGGMAGVPPAFQQLTTMIAQAQAAQRGIATGSFGALQSQFNQQLQTALLHTQQMDGLSQQKHELFVTGMLSDATAAGLDVSSWRIR
jgi:hypothetical protein